MNYVISCSSRIIVDAMNHEGNMKEFTSGQSTKGREIFLVEVCMTQVAQLGEFIVLIFKSNSIWF